MFVFDPTRSVFLKAPHNAHKSEVVAFLTAQGVEVARMHINGRFYFIELKSAAQRDQLLQHDKVRRDSRRA